MKTGLLLLCGLLTAQVAFALQSTAGQVRASYYAYNLHKVKKPEDLLKLNLSNFKNKELQKEVKTFKNFAPPLISMPNRNTVLVKTKNLKIPIVFSDVKSEVKVFSQTIIIKKNKTFLNYKAEFEIAIRRAPKNVARSLWFDVAHAESSDWLPSFLGSVFTSNSYNLKEGSSAEDIISAYHEDAKRYQEYDRQHNQLPSLHTLTFTCSGNQLATVKESFVIYGGGRHEGFDTDGLIVRNPDSTFTYTAATCMSGARFSADGILESSSAGCPAQGNNFYEMAPFFQYPLVARDCCATQGCYEKVQSALTDVINKQMNPDGVAQ